MFQKSIAPNFVQVGKRRKMTGVIGELSDGHTILHSKEYGSYSEAEIALDSLMFDLLTDWQMDNNADDADPDCDLNVSMADDDYADAMAESAQGTYNGFIPSTCCFCHKPHHPQHCPEMRALLFAPDAIFSDISALIYPPLDVEFAPIGPEV